MSENKGTETDLAESTAQNGVCPFLGWQVDAETHHAYPSAANQCHTQNPPLTVELAYQASTCLEGEWTACPRFKAAQSEGVLDKPAAMAWIGRPNGQSRKLPGWAIAGMGVAVVALIAGLFLILGPATGLTGSATPTKAAALAQSTATSVSSKTSTQVSKPVTSPTSTPEPTKTSFPTQSSSPTLPPTPTLTESPSATPSPTPSSLPTETVQAATTPGRGTGTPETKPAAGWTSTATATTPPTATATPTMEPTATLAPTNTPRPTARPTSPPPPPAPTPTPAVRPQFPAPPLLSPTNGQVFSSRDTIVLRWEPVGQLAPDEYYVPAVHYLRYGDSWPDETPWLKEPSWEMSEHRYLLELSDDGDFRWAVRVMRRTGINNEGKPEGTARSPMSEVRTLEWKRPGGGGDDDGGSGPPPP